MLIRPGHRAGEPPAVADITPAPAQRPAAVLVVRVWHEGTLDEPALRIRMVTRDDIASDALESVWMASVPDSVEFVKAWLERVSSKT